MKINCSPDRVNDNICIDWDLLLKIINDYNKKNPNNKIIINNENKKYLFKTLLKKLNCNDIRCLYSKNFNLSLKDYTKLNKNTFRPFIHKKEIINNFIIINAMNQYTNIFKNFIFLGCLPIDFKNYNLLKVDFNKLYIKNIIKFSIIFNLDVYIGSGTHWVCLYFNLNNGKILYFDSYGFNPKKEIKNFINEIIKIIISYNKIPILIYNKKRHQYNNDECGIYCLYFLINILENENNYKYMFKNKIKNIKKFRRIIFNEYI